MREKGAEDASPGGSTAQPGSEFPPLGETQAEGIRR